MFGSTLRIAWRNLGRAPRRTAIALTAIAVAQAAVLAMNGLLNGRSDWMLDALTGPMMGHAQIHAPLWREEQAPDLVIDRLGERLEVLRRTPGVEQAYARVYAPALAARDVEGQAVMVIGIDVELESRDGGLLEGLPEEILPHERHVLIGSALARDAGIAVGDELAMLGQRADGSIANDLVVVSGILRTPVDIINRLGVIMPIEASQDVFGMPDMAHEITLRGVGGADAASALVASVSALPELAALEILPWRELAPELSGVIEQSAVVGMIALLIVFVAAAAGVANTMLMATFERRRELGVLLSLGTMPGRLVRMILLEAVMLGFLGVLIGSVLGAILVFYQGQTGISLAMGAEKATDIAVFGLNFSGSLYPYLRFTDYVPGFIGVTLVSIAASLWPALFTARLEPMEAMKS